MNKKKTTLSLIAVSIFILTAVFAYTFFKVEPRNHPEENETRNPEAINDPLIESKQLGHSTPAATAKAPSSSQSRNPRVSSSLHVEHNELLPIEKTFIRGNEVYYPMLSDALKGENFEKIVDLLKEQMSGNPLAREIHDAYSIEITEALASRDMKMLRLACGVKICIGSADYEKKPPSQENLPEWFEALGSNGLSSLFGIHEPENQDGRIEQRFFFSTDPELNSMFSPYQGH